MTNDEQGAVWLGRDRHAAKLAVLRRIASRGMKSALRNAWRRSYDLGVMFARMRVWDDDLPRSGPESMAIDEWLLESSEIPVLRVYRWRGNWGSLGYFGAIDQAKEQFPGLDWVRRRTGGGIVDHRCDWTYTIVDPAGGPLAKGRGDESYRIIHEALADALKYCGVETRMSAGETESGATACFENPVKRDLVSIDGKKIAGAGQRRTRHGLLHQGSLAMRQDSVVGLAEQLAARLTSSWEFAHMCPPSGLIDQKVADMYGVDSWTHRR